MSDTTIQKSNKIDLGSGKILPLLCRLAIPTMIAQLVNVLYSVVDRMYIGNMANVSELALAGLGACLPVIMIISAFSALIGSGGAPRVSIKLGEKDKDGAEKIVGNSVVILVSLALVLTVVFFIFKEPILLAFGATEKSLPFANEYLTYYLLGSTFVLLSLGLNPFINAQGFTRIGMYTVLIGAVLNIALDPIFIFAFNMGIKGAAIATVISQGVSAIWVVLFLGRKKSQSILKIKFANFKLNSKVILSILALGIAPFIMQSTESLVQITLNNGMKNYGGELADVYVASMTIMMSVMQMCVMPLSGLAQGAQPLISYNYGAKNMDRVRETFKILIISCVLVSLVVFGLSIAFPWIFARPFTSKQIVLDTVSKNMPIFFAGMTLFGIQIACQNTFLALGQASKSLILALLRKIVLLVPLALILPLKLGILGVFVAEPVSDILAIIITSLLFFLSFNKILNKKSLGNIDTN